MGSRCAVPLVGLFVGAFVQSHLQFKQWRRDNRKQEYRELLTALSETFLNILRHGTGPQNSDNPPLNVAGASIDGFKTLHDRIFIAEEIKGAAIMGKWLTVCDLSNTPGGLPESMNKFTALKDELVRMALKEPRSF